MNDNERARELFFKGLGSLEKRDFYNSEQLFYETLKFAPRSVPTLNNLAIAQYEQGKIGDATLTAQKVIEIDAENIDAYLTLSICQKDQQLFEEVVKTCEKIISIDATIAEAHCNLGYALGKNRNYEEAIASFDCAIELNPQFAEAYLNLGNALSNLKRYNEAFAAYEKALVLKPDLAEAWLGLANRHFELGKHDKAARDYAKVLDIDPSFPFAKGNLLHQKMMICDWHEVKSLIEEIEVDVASGKLSAEPFGWQGVAKSERSLQLCANLYNKHKFPAHLKRYRETALVKKTEKIRVGYLSGEFLDQATSHLLVGVLENHDHRKFDIYAFDNGWDDKSEIRQRINASVPNIIDISRLSDLSARDLIGDNQIDILVNLNGYFGRSRTGVFAQRAAPIQVNYLGFPGTLGATYMDYIIADEHVIPENNKVFYNEKVVYLPNSYQANDQKKKISSRVFSRAECGLPKMGFVFCCFNNSYKITPDIFDCWVRILKRVEGSVLWLLESNVTAAQNLRMEAKGRGINPERLVFAKHFPLPDHLARLALADLCLDTLPYNAHTTASDALWVGLPLLTQIGETFAGRVGSSLLNAIDMPELVTTTEQAYEALAIELASNSAKLRDLKRKLFNRRFSTALFDTRLFTRHIEKAFSAMSDRFQKGLSPDHIWVSR